MLIDAILKERFAIDQLRPKQKEVIDHVLAGENVLALLPTGYGKSLCYQLPSQILPGPTLVVSPLIALMRDQVQSLRNRGIDGVTLLNSSIEYEDQEERISGIVSGAYKLIYVAPERFESARFRSLISKINVSLFVIDEAHCISQWGHDFRPQYRNFSKYIALAPNASLLALTATATKHVRDDIIKSLNLPDIKIVESSFNRSNLHFEVVDISSSAQKDKEVLKALSQSSGSNIIYTSSRKECERLSSWLTSLGKSAAYYHAGMPASRRDAIQQQFESDKTKTIVCTVAFGMGIDKANIRCVIHYNLPASLESYYQEVGRAGRDGKFARCSLLFQSKDANTQRWLASRNYPSVLQLNKLFELLQSKNHRLTQSELLDCTDMTESALNNSLDLLKHQNVIDANMEGSYKLTEKGTDQDAVWQLLLDRKELSERRLAHMIDYAKSNYCRRVSILKYFGQELQETCTSCDVCESQLHNKVLPMAAAFIH